MSLAIPLARNFETGRRKMRKPMVPLAGLRLNRSGNTRGFANYKPEAIDSFFHNNHPTSDSFMGKSLHNKIGGDERNNMVFMAGIMLVKSLIDKGEGVER
jgi:hypothetical protein